MVTHGGVINIICHLIKDIEWTNESKVFKPQNTSIYKIEIDGEKIGITLNNYIEHLNWWKKV